MNLRPLDNIAWHTLTGPHASHATGEGGMRRYDRGYSPIVAFVDPQRPDFDTLARHCDADEPLYCPGWAGPAPAGWRLVAAATMYCMVWDAPAPERDDAPDALRLGPQHAAQALELAGLTRPGPFGLSTIELGEYFGCFDGDRLVAMAGERMVAGTLREISGVCTHPEQQGRGLARRLMRKLIHRETARGELPFLHVLRDNSSARDLYERMGFRIHHETPIQVIARQEVMPRQDRAHIGED